MAFGIFTSTKPDTFRSICASLRPCIERNRNARIGDTHDRYTFFNAPHSGLGKMLPGPGVFPNQASLVRLTSVGRGPRISSGKWPHSRSEPGSGRIPEDRTPHFHPLGRNPPGQQARQQKAARIGTGQIHRREQDGVLNRAIQFHPKAGQGRPN